ncbi:hypothetical protein EBU95_19380 [bacterium]|nr:hypothetical protein [bacterium]
MALATIDNLKTTLGIGARPNLFKIGFTWPTNVVALLGKDAKAAQDTATGVATKANYLCKAAAIPAFTVGVIEVPYRGGRRIKVPGDRTFGDWTATFIADDSHSMRNSLNAWINYIKLNDYESETLRPGTATSGFDYMIDIDIFQLNSKGETARHYRLFDAFPTDVGAIDLSFDSTDTISEFTATFQYHSLTAVEGNAEINSKTSIGLEEET